MNLPKFRRDQTDSDGTYTLRDVLPGRYRMLAIDDGWELEWANLSLLKNRLEHAQKIEVQPNKTYQTVLNVE
jgi:protocatechuate 3,4-dioxygenase beta subunit